MRLASIGDLHELGLCANWIEEQRIQMNDTHMVIDQTEWQLRASMALDAAIASGHLITYAELADAARINKPYRIRKLTLWLETLIESDHQSAKPIRAAWVISRHREQIPAPGFFMKCQDLGLYDGAYRGQQAAAFHRQLLMHQLF